MRRTDSASSLVVVPKLARSCWMAGGTGGTLAGGWPEVHGTWSLKTFVGANLRGGLDSSVFGSHRRLCHCSRSRRLRWMKDWRGGGDGSVMRRGWTL